MNAATERRDVVRTAYDTYGDAYDVVSVREVIAVVEEATGLTDGYLEMTGGNCAAIHWDLEAFYILLTDGDIFTYSDGDAQRYCPGWNVGVYLNDQEDSTLFAYGETVHVDNASLLAAVVSAVRLENRAA